MQESPPSGPRSSLEIPITIRFGDTDPYGVVYFASYFRYCHHGIEEFLRHVGLPPSSMFRNQEQGFGLPIVAASCDFRRPVWYGEEIIMEVAVLRMSNKALTFGFRFRRAGRDELVAQGQATLVAIGPDWLSRALPERLRDAVAPYLVSAALNQIESETPRPRPRLITLPFVAASSNEYGSHPEAPSCGNVILPRSGLKAPPHRGGPYAHR